MSAYYNEIDPYAAEWLRTLIMMGHIADGVVDTRSISEIEPNELREFTQCHFFAGIGVWSHALRTAGWSDDRPVWTGSCPCQPFSSAGLAGGFADERHLWPHWHHLIRECRPEVVFGEQVASKDGLAWLDLVHSDMEGEGYAFAPFDLCAAGLGAPHIRQRLYFVADTDAHGRVEGVQSLPRGLPEWSGRNHQSDGLGNADHARSQEHGRPGELHLRESDRTDLRGFNIDAGVAGRVDDAKRDGRGAGRDHDAQDDRVLSDAARDTDRSSPTNGHWRDADWLHCRDGKWRCVEPGTFPLAHGAPGRVGRLRAYGNAIVAQVAAEMIGAYLDVRG